MTFNQQQQRLCPLCSLAVIGGQTEVSDHQTSGFVWGCVERVAQTDSLVQGYLQI